MKRNTVFSFAASLNTNIRLSGKFIPAKKVLLRAGNLRMTYENGSIRMITSGKTEIIRMIYPAVRDKSWLTIKPLIEDEHVIANEDSFVISYRAIYASEEIHFTSDYRFEGRSDSTISLSMEGETAGITVKNRIGFCVLHPTSLAGTKCMIQHFDGNEENSVFPILISPHQPFTDIRSMRWSDGGMRCRIDFLGDVFETEDQRNWTDDSYKTYSTPLRLAFPVTLEAGEKIIQKIELYVTGKADDHDESGDFIKFSYDEGRKKPVPRIGIGRSSRHEALSTSEAEIIKLAGFTHYRAEIHMFSQSWKDDIERVADESARLDLPVEFVLVTGSDAVKEVNEFIMQAVEQRIVISVITLFSNSEQTTPEEYSGSIVPLLKKAFPSVKIGCGTNCNFAQLNRKRPGTEKYDLISWAIHPQEHAGDNPTLTENLKGQKSTVVSGRSFAAGRKIWISPVTIQRRFNANLSVFELQHEGPGISPQIDTRMMSLYGACWTAGSIKYLGGSGVSGITYYETKGERGIIQGDYPSKWPEVFNSVPGMIFPVYHLFRFIPGEQEWSIMESTSSQPLKAEMLAFSDGVNYKFIVINFTHEPQAVELNISGLKAGIKHLNASTFTEAASDPLWLEKAEGIPLTSGMIVLEPCSVGFIFGH